MWNDHKEKQTVHKETQNVYKDTQKDANAYKEMHNYTEIQ